MLAVMVAASEAGTLCPPYTSSSPTPVQATTTKYAFPSKVWGDSLLVRTLWVPGREWGAHRASSWDPRLMTEAGSARLNPGALRTLCWGPASQHGPRGFQ